MYSYLKNRILAGVLEGKQVTKKSSPSILITIIIVIIVSVSIMIFVIMFIFVSTLDLDYLVYLALVQPYSPARRTVINRCLVPLP